MEIAFKPARFISSPLVISILSVTLIACKAQNHKNPVVWHKVSIDLSKRAPIGYEICPEGSVTLSRGVIDLKLLMPQRIEIPTEFQEYGVKSIEFHPGRHEVDLYKNLHSGRAVYTMGDLAIEAGRPTLRVMLDTTKLSKGTYVLGISGYPFFAHCAVDIE